MAKFGSACMTWTPQVHCTVYDEKSHIQGHTWMLTIGSSSLPRFFSTLLHSLEGCLPTFCKKMSSFKTCPSCPLRLGWPATWSGR